MEYADGHSFDVDVCIIGGGPAGLTLANELVGTSQRVLLLERGGAPGKPVGTFETRFEDAGSTFELPPSVQPRLGGAANEWMVRLPWHRRGVRMIPLAPSDFERRDWVSHSGWPISRSDLDPFYRRAHDLLDLGPFDERIERWTTSRRQPIELGEHGFDSSVERFADPAVFTERVRARLEQADNVHILLHASGGMLDRTANGVDRLEIDAGRPGRLEARARTFVLAGGGTENAGMLLRACRGAGLGNEHDAVGRYHIDHVRTVPGVLVPNPDRPISSYGLYDFRQQNGSFVGSKLVVTAEAQRREQVLSSAIQLLPKPTDEMTNALQVSRDYLTDGLARSQRPPITTMLKAARYVARYAPEMALRQRRVPPRTDAGWARTRSTDRAYASFELELQTELTPDPSNRITLSPTERDELGRPRQRMAWRSTDGDIESIHRTRELLSKAIAAAELGEFRPAPWPDDMPPLSTPEGAHHPSGSTRMSLDRRESVVDASCRVHGAPNVAVVGASVFPTNGYANPTLTILALAIRLADDIKHRG